MRAIVLLSGGLDSAVAFYWANSKGWDVYTIEFEYHMRPKRERNACRDLRERAGITRKIVVPLQFICEVSDISPQELLNPSLSRAPEGYIPSRNLIFYSLAAYHAEVLGARLIVGGHNRNDCESFPDAGKSFWEQLNRLLMTAMWSHSEVQTEIVLPLIELTKLDIIRLGAKLGVPFEVTWSCYGNADRPCGSCPSCLERDHAFKAVGNSQGK